MYSKPLWLSFVLAAVLSVAVGCSSGVSVLEPVVEGIQPNCGDRAAETAVTVLGTLPVKTVAPHEGSEATIDSTYHAWVGTTELTEVKWVDGHTLTAVVPASIPAGTYGLTLRSPFDTRSTKDALFEVRAGECHCVPRCAGKTCGDDGCGGTCGTCPSGTQCSSAGTCACTPNCSGRACGDDGCGGTCGTCEVRWSCSTSGACVPPTCRASVGWNDCPGSDYHCSSDPVWSGTCCPPTRPYGCSNWYHPSCHSTAAAAAATCGGNCLECVP